MRVLFADDQIPSPSNAENERYKEELRKELAAKLDNFEAAYREDYKLTGCRSLAAAIKLMGKVLDSSKSKPKTKWSEATMADIIRSLPFAQVWGLVVAVVTSVAAVAGIAYRLGATFGTSHR